MPSAIGGAAATAPFAFQETERSPLLPTDGLASALDGAANAPRPSVMRGLAQYLAPLGRRIAATFASIGNGGARPAERPAPYDAAALDAWVRDAAPGENRAQAAARVARYQSYALDLCGLNLHSLPPLPSHVESLLCMENRLLELPALPSSLKILVCWDNPQLSSLPALPAALQRLDISRCPFTELPPLPPALRWLTANGCGLESVPQQWPESLRGLELSSNQIREIGELPTQLVGTVNLRENQLTELPRNWLQLESCSDLWLEGNPLSERTLELLLHLGPLINNPAYRGPAIGFSLEGPNWVDPRARPLRDAAAAWYGQGHSSDVAQRWATFEGEVGAKDFVRFLDRLAQSINATKGALAKPFRAHIVQWLTHLAEHPTLRQDTLAIAAAGNERCEDRTSTVLLEMTRLRVNYDVASKLYDAEPTALLAALQGTRRLEALETIALEKIRGMELVDDVEVILAYPVALRERLGLPIGVQAMRFPQFSFVGKRDLDQAEARVRALDATFPEYLAGHAPFHAVLERWAPERFAQARDWRDECMEDGTYEARVQQLISTMSSELGQDAVARSQAGKVALEELQVQAFGALVRAYLDRAQFAGAQSQSATSGEGTSSLESPTAP